MTVHSCFIHNKKFSQASQLIYQKIKELEEKQRLEEENKLLLLELQLDFEREEARQRDDMFTEQLLLEYERIQMILNKSPPKSQQTQTQ